jgi:hypothetical protein
LIKEVFQVATENLEKRRRNIEFQSATVLGNQVPRSSFIGEPS